MERVTVQEASSWSYRGLELFLVVPAVMMGLFGAVSLAVGVLGSGSASGGPGATAGVISALAVGVGTVRLVMVPVGLVSIIAIPVGLYFDAGMVRQQNLDWQPTKGLYAGLGFLFNSLVVWDYLYKRHRYVVDWVDSTFWWFLALVGIGIEAVGLVMASIEPSLFVISFVGLPFFALGIYKDATYVRLNSGWHPNPVTHFLAAFFSGIFSIIGLLYFAY